MAEQYTVTIESVDYEGKGIARIEGKTVFVYGALAGEEVLIEIVKRKPSFDKAKLVEIIQASPKRVTPECPNYGVCGGCSMQHVSFDEQIRIKQQVLTDNLQHLGNVVAEEIMSPLAGVPWGYRHRARLSARYVAKKGGALVGFREKGAPYVLDMHECLILPPHVSALITPLRELVSGLSIRDKIPQIEVAVGTQITILVIRNMEALNPEDEHLIRQFIEQYSSLENPLQIWLQPKGPETCYPFYPVDAPKLSYTIQRFSLDIPYNPSEFTQVNPYINEEMLALSMELLAPQAHEVIADFFCGIGNFTLPIARLAKQVVGIEGADVLVKRAKQNAIHNGLGDKVAYQVCNLFTIDDVWLQKLGHFDKWLIDPPRDGAFELVKSITPQTAPQRIVYVSCNPATLARDAGVLVHTHGYRLLKAGVMNMFPHTSHVESIALFERD
ncbi:MAG: rRNA (uracil1939-C5)-methyltransferase [Pseudomonadota bacterium]|jgi:23S rRNA (uracil1939-C5)-methyltransferase|nr:rRNA (uracil1939-C5)-methyltransferase [Pseudomonadota bacterium]HCY38991.1 23S rRNA (uracil(1939)-C(5))-methyltransferase RlmD [Neisseriales bacterium]